MTSKTSVPSQVRHPWKTSVRTAIQTFIAFAIIAGLAAPELQGFVGQFWPGSPLVAWIGTGAVFVGALAGLITRLAAIPGVDSLLTKAGLGAEPKK